MLIDSVLLSDVLFVKSINRNILVSTPVHAKLIISMTNAKRFLFWLSARIARKFIYFVYFNILSDK